jgi:hypothetical protein
MGTRELYFAFFSTAMFKVKENDWRILRGVEYESCG